MNSLLANGNCFTRENRKQRTDRICRRLGISLALTLSVPFVGAADMFKGTQIYSRHCAACHGPNGISVMPGAPHLARGEKMMQSDMAMLVALKSGRGAMPSYLGVLSDAEILDVIAYTRTLR